ncbi:hypothetical protein KY342_01045 [Candidatus Woesearchaeota archaeon]|nr:hypothetical protein [Candidatus Woesearchaeota archaeon]
MVSYGYGLDYFIQLLESWGVADILLPFLLIFTIVFAVLQKTKILGEGKKNFNVVIALVVALSVVIPHVIGTYPPEADVVDIINTIIPQISLVAVAFIMLLILTGIFTPRWVSRSIAGILAFISFIAVFVIIGSALNWWESGWLYDIFGEETIALLVVILVFGVIIWFITREPGGPAEKATKKLKDFFEWFGGA